MKVDFNSNLIDVRDGQPLIAQLPVVGSYVEDENGKPLLINGQKLQKMEDKILTLKYVAGEAFARMLEEDRGLSYEEKRKHGRLIEKIYRRPNGDFTTEELTTIKNRIGKSYGTLVVMAVENIIDPPAVEENSGEKNGTESA